MNRLFVDNLTVIDFSYLHADRGIVGESWIVDVELTGELDVQGMVFDFGHVKKQLKNLIDTEADHKLIVPRQMTGVLIEQSQFQLDIGYRNTRNERWIHRSPIDSVVLLDSDEVTQEAVANYIIELLDEVLPDNVQGASLTIRTEQTETAFYHYSHGLKKHEGNCQRIAHGHRSKIEITLDDIRSPELEDKWAHLFKDIYIGSIEDLVQPEVVQAEPESYTFTYRSAQGNFELTLPARQVYLLETDSTVELIATHITSKIKENHPEKFVMVKAFEGVGKGAIAEA